ncbi:MAG: hypothetical protein WA802_07775 [Terracidiphilus sp.]
MRIHSNQERRDEAAETMAARMGTKDEDPVAKIHLDWHVKAELLWETGAKIKGD